MLLVLLALGIVSTMGCGATSRRPADTTPASPASGAVTAAPPLVGVFAGTLPCADCSGIRTELTLYGEPRSPTSGGPYMLKETYLGTRDGDRTFETTGQWLIQRGSAVDIDATVYQLTPASRSDPRYVLRVNDETLRTLDRELREIPSAANHTLMRTNRPSLGAYTTIDAADVGVTQAANFAVTDRAAKTGEVVTLTAISRAERQVVAGMNYRLCLDVVTNGAKGRIRAVVYRDPQQRFQLTQWTIGGCVGQ